MRGAPRRKLKSLSQVLQSLPEPHTMHYEPERDANELDMDEPTENGVDPSPQDPSPQDPAEPHRNMGPIAFGFEMTMGIVALAVGWLVAYSPLQNLHVTDLPGPELALDVGWGLLATVPLLLVLLADRLLPIESLTDMRMVIESVVVPMFRRLTIWEFALVSGAAGFGEELLFRGLLQDGLSHWGGVAFGLIASNVIFGLLHWLNTGYAILAGITGIYLGLVYLMTGNLLPVMIAHGLYDFIALIVLVRIRAQPE